MRLILVIALLLTVAVSSRAADESRPLRVVSLDYCADQFVLKLLPKSDILALSPDAEKQFSYLRDKAAGIPKVRPIAEDLLSIRPGLVVRLYGGGPQIGRLLERTGVPVVQIPYTQNITEIRDAVLQVAEALGATERGRAIVAEMDQRLSELPQPAADTTVLYMTPGGVTSGPGTSIHEMLTTAGLENFQSLPGWRSIPLERLAHEQPDIIAATFFHHRAQQPAMWSAMRHPVAKRQLQQRPTVMIDGAWTSCGGWFVLDAIEALATAGAAETTS